MLQSDQNIGHNFRIVLFIISILLVLISFSDKAQMYNTSSGSGSVKHESTLQISDSHSEYIVSGNDYVSILQSQINVFTGSKWNNQILIKDRLSEYKLMLGRILSETEKERLSFAPNEIHKITNMLIRPETGEIPDLG